MQDISTSGWNDMTNAEQQALAISLAGYWLARDRFNKRGSADPKLLHQVCNLLILSGCLRALYTKL